MLNQFTTTLHLYEAHLASCKRRQLPVLVRFGPKDVIAYECMRGCGSATGAVLTLLLHPASSLAPFLSFIFLVV